MGEVGGNEDSGQADADLNCPEPCPKHRPQHPARGRQPRQSQGQLMLPSMPPLHTLSSAWPPAEPIPMHTPPRVPCPGYRPTASCLGGLSCAPVSSGAASAQHGWFWHTAYQYLSVLDLFFPMAVDRRAVTMM